MKLNKLFLLLLILLAGFALIFSSCGKEKGQEPKKAAPSTVKTEKQTTPVKVEKSKPEPSQEVVEPAKMAAAPEPEAKKAKTTKQSGWFTAASHVVKKGECLWWIAQYREVYNDPWQWHRIYEANRDQIEDPDVIYPGQVFTIPR